MTLVVNKGLLVLYDTWVLHRGQNPNFIYRIFSLFFRKMVKFDLLERVLIAVSQSSDLVDIGIGSVT